MTPRIIFGLRVTGVMKVTIGRKCGIMGVNASSLYLFRYAKNLCGES